MNENEIYNLALFINGGLIAVLNKPTSKEVFSKVKLALEEHFDERVSDVEMQYYPKPGKGCNGSAEVGNYPLDFNLEVTTIY